MATDRLILVAGATGAQGRATVDALLKTGWRVRALVRDPRSANATALRRNGVELAQGEFDDVGSLRSAMSGAHGAFSMQNVSPPDDPGRELRHGRKFVETALEAGIQILVHSSVARAGRQKEFSGWAHGRWPENYWNSKSGVNDLVRAAGPTKWVIIKPAYLLENFLPPKAAFMYPGLERRLIETVMGSDVRLDVVSARDVGRVVAAAFADPVRFAGQEIDLATASVTMPELAQYIAAATGQLVKAVSLPPQSLIENGYSPGVVDNQIWATDEGYQVDLVRAASFGVSLESPAEWASRNRDNFRFA